VEDRIRLIDIADSIREIQGYVDGLTYEQFGMREDIREPVISHLTQIGGAVAVLSDEFKNHYREIDWDILIGLQYTHYDEEMEMDQHCIWHIIHNDLPELLEQISDLSIEIERNEIDDDLTFEEERILLNKIANEEKESEYYYNRRLGDQMNDEEKSYDDNEESRPLKPEEDYFIKSVNGREIDMAEVEDDSYIDQRYEDEDLFENSSLDKDPREGEE